MTLWAWGYSTAAPVRYRPRGQKIPPRASDGGAEPAATPTHPTGHCQGPAWGDITRDAGWLPGATGSSATQRSQARSPVSRSCVERLGSNRGKGSRSNWGDTGCPTRAHATHTGPLSRRRARGRGLSLCRAPPSGWDAWAASSSERRGPACPGRCAPRHPDVHLGTQMCPGCAAAAGCGGASASAGPGCQVQPFPAPLPTALPGAKAGVGRRESAGEDIWVPEMRGLAYNLSHALKKIGSRLP